MAIEPHIHEYALLIGVVATGDFDASDISAFCTHPDCDHKLDPVGIINRINAAERLMKWKDGEPSGVASSPEANF